jgi:hypothetical protein
LFASGVAEATDILFGRRARLLRSAIRGMLKDDKGDELADRFYRHPLIATLSAGGRPPAYIPGTYFAGAVGDLVFGNDYSHPIQSITANVQGQAQSALKALIRAKDDESEIKDKLEKWFYAVADQFANTYRISTLKIIIVASCALAVLLNLDAVRMFARSAQESANREILSSFAKESAKAHANESIPAILDRVNEFGKHVEVPFGWTGLHSFPQTGLEWVQVGIGWTLSAILITVAAGVLFSIFRGQLPITARARR